MPSYSRQIIIGALIAVAIIGIGIWTAFPDDSPNQQAASTRKQAPDFSLPTPAGKTIQLTDITAPITVINLWASWCPFCTKELPAFARLQMTFPKQVRVIAINRGESKQAAQSFIKSADLGGRLTFLLDKDESYYRAIGGFAMPETLFLNADKQIVRHQRGPLSFEQMESIIKKMLDTTATTTSLNAASSSGGCMAGICQPHAG